MTKMKALSIQIYSKGSYYVNVPIFFNELVLIPLRSVFNKRSANTFVHPVTSYQIISNIIIVNSLHYVYYQRVLH